MTGDDGLASADCRWLPYSLPLLRPWATAGGTLRERHGWLLRADAGDGRIGWGDAAPLPEIGIDAGMARTHAEECARLDLAAQAAGLPLWAWLKDHPNGANSLALTPSDRAERRRMNSPLTNRPPGAPITIPVNAALGDLLQVSDDDIDAACAAGFATLKLKVACAPPAAELPRLHALAARLPAGVMLRLDANGGWDEATAREFLAACVDLPVEAVEEPLRYPSPDTLRALQAGVPFPLALDESLGEFTLEALLAAPPVRRLVLKPARHGGLLATLALARRAQAAGIECIVTSALESTCGLLAAAHLAAALAPDLAHGLATASWLAADTGQPPAIAAGRLRLPTAPGLGFAPLS